MSGAVAGSVRPRCRGYPLSARRVYLEGAVDWAAGCVAIGGFTGRALLVSDGGGYIRSRCCFAECSLDDLRAAGRHGCGLYQAPLTGQRVIPGAVGWAVGRGTRRVGIAEE